MHPQRKAPLAILVGVLVSFRWVHAGDSPTVYPVCDRLAECGAAPKTLFRWPQTAAEDEAEEDADDVIVTDRPDFTEASSTVGKGRLQLEAGYTFSRERNGDERTDSHSYPETLFRLGVLHEWLELRIGWNHGHEENATFRGVERVSGAQDLYLGTKIALFEQDGWLPEVAAILQMTVPTGSESFTSGEVIPGFSLLYAWEVTDRWAIGGSSLVFRRIDEVDAVYTEFAQSFTSGFRLTEKVGTYTEWFAFIPSGADDPGTGPEHYLNGGFTYLVNSNLQLDIRAGVGLNRHADNFFTGAGFAVRF